MIDLKIPDLTWDYPVPDLEDIFETIDACENQMVIQNYDYTSTVIAHHNRAMRGHSIVYLHSDDDLAIYLTSTPQPVNKKVQALSYDVISMWMKHFPVMSQADQVRQYYGYMVSRKSREWWYDPNTDYGSYFVTDYFIGKYEKSADFDMFNSLWKHSMTACAVDKTKLHSMASRKIEFVGATPVDDLQIRLYVDLITRHEYFKNSVQHVSRHTTVALEETVGPILDQWSLDHLNHALPGLVLDFSKDVVIDEQDMALLMYSR